MIGNSGRSKLPHISSELSFFPGVLSSSGEDEDIASLLFVLYAELCTETSGVGNGSFHVIAPLLLLFLTGV